MQMISETSQLHYLRKKLLHSVKSIALQKFFYHQLKSLQAYKLNYLGGIKRRQPILTTMI